MNQVLTIVRKHLSALTAELATMPTVVVEDVEIDFNDGCVGATVYRYPEVGEAYDWGCRIWGEILESGSVEWDGHKILDPLKYG